MTFPTHIAPALGPLYITCPRSQQPCVRQACFNGAACQSGPTPGVFQNPGWMCPRCGRGNAPGTATCPCIPPEPVRITC